MLSTRTLGISLVPLSAAILFHCSTPGLDIGDDTDGGGDLGEGGLPPNFGDGGVGALSIVPPAATLNVVYGAPAQTQQFTAMAGGVAVPVSWTVDSAGFGSIDGSGLFTTAGTKGGVLNVIAQANGATAQAVLTINLTWTENPGGVPGPVQTALLGGGSSDPSFRWLYPYDKTVWPRGLKPALLQFDGTAGDAYLVQVNEPHFTYTGFYGATNPSTVPLGVPEWKAILSSAGAGDPVAIKGTKISGSAVTGPTAETWTVAQGSLKGSIYYDTYDFAAGGGGQGAIMRVPIGGDVSLFKRDGGTCNVCHSVSARGNVMVTNVGFIADPSPFSAAFDLTTAGAPILGPKMPSQLYPFGALSPDGTVVVTGVGGYDIGPSALYEVSTGKSLFDMQSNFGFSPYTPYFSPDAKKLVFAKGGQGQTLSMLNYNSSTRVFSGPVDIFTDPQAGSYPRWPVPLPTNDAILFQRGTSDQGETRGPHTGDLFSVDLKTKTLTRLDALDGYDSKGQPNLPRGSAETGYTYEPTILPVGEGGYAWVVFTSRRMYGNQITASDPFSSFGTTSAPARKKVWLAAIDLHPTPGADPSHPAIYLDGQDPVAANLRAFVALDPCKPDGQTCEEGYECCGGACREQPDGTFTCGQPKGCSLSGDACKVSSDCCGTNLECIAGFCASPPPN